MWWCCARTTLAAGAGERRGERPKEDRLKPERTDQRQARRKEDRKSAEVKIDLEDIDQRILALPIPARDYVGLAAGKDRHAVLHREDRGYARSAGAAGETLQKFDLKTRKTDKSAGRHQRYFEISANGEKMLLPAGRERGSSPATAAPPKPGEGALKLEGMEVRVDPRAEWKQMYHEVWRIERDFFYDPDLHGLESGRVAQKKYEPYLDKRRQPRRPELPVRGDAGRADRRATCSSAAATMPEVKQVHGGLLGADYKIENGRYRFARVYNGENWNPQLKAPLTQPGVNVAAGEYLLAVNGRDVRAARECLQLLRRDRRQVGGASRRPEPDGSGSREVTVVPVENEIGLRNLAWIEDNRRKVDQMSGGRLAYVYLPDTADGGYTNFNRYYFAQVGKEAP